MWFTCFSPEPSPDYLVFNLSCASLSYLLEYGHWIFRSSIWNTKSIKFTQILFIIFLEDSQTAATLCSNSSANGGRTT